MKQKNAAAFCRDIQTDDLLRAQVRRVVDGSNRSARLVEVGRNSGYRFTAEELEAEMADLPVETSPLAGVAVTRDLSAEQLAAVSGAGWSMEEHWAVTVSKPVIPGSGLPNLP